MPSFFSNMTVLRPLALIVLAAATRPAVAQTHATPPQSDPLPQTLPGLDNFSITPRKPVPFPTPVSTPRPAAGPSESPAQVAPIRPLPSGTSTPRSTPTPIAKARPSAPRLVRPNSVRSPSPTPAAAMTAAQAVSPASSKSPASAVPPTAASPASDPPVIPTAPGNIPPSSPVVRHSLLWIALFITMLLLPGLFVALWFLKHSPTNSGAAAPWQDDEDDWIAEDQLSPPPAAQQAAGTRQTAPAEKAELALAFTPRRAGINLTGGAVDYDLVISNCGAAPATDIAVAVQLLSAGNDHDTLLKALFGAPIDQPVTAPFTLAPGEERRLRALALVPQHAISAVNAAARPMFVPIIAVDARYRCESGEHQTAESFVVGIAGKQGERMRPIWLDVAARMHDAVAARPHDVSVKR